MKKTGIVTLLMILGSFYTKSQNNALSNNPNHLSLTKKFIYFDKNLYTVKFSNHTSENFKSTSVTYWQPTLEWHYTYDSNTNLWVLSDSTRYIYNTSPAIVNGLINTAFSYLLSPPQIFKDTFSYNSNGNHILHKNILLGSTPGAFTVNYV
ncbi:MAG: hypothetical protein N2203_03395, partial [Bacteroidia bacterium]|nr:hypothetical protein [Bacteroidia bacterium]